MMADGLRDGPLEPIARNAALRKGTQPCAKDSQGGPLYRALVGQAGVIYFILSSGV